MKQLVIIVFTILLFSSCSKQESCYCHLAEGGYEYMPPSTNTQSSGTVNASGDLEQECELEDARLKQTHSPSAYCEMK